MTTKTDTITNSPLETYLSQHDEDAWAAALTTLLRSIHDVDKNATQIWFAFYPLSVFHAFQETDDAEELVRQLLIKGNYRLKDQIDSSHKFLYGHRYWPKVKSAVEAFAASYDSADGDKLADQILKVAGEVARANGFDESLVVGITAVAFMTLQQSGLAAFKSAKGEMLLDRKHAKQTPEQILRERAKDNSQGLFGFLRTVDKKWTVTYDETDDSASYQMNNDQDMAWGAADDRTRNWREIDPRRPEGPIPVECRSASCGTCWVGILGGAEKLSDVAVREGKQIKDFGYINTPEPKPLIRLACQAKTYGAVSIVIPPWNGVFGKYLKDQKRTTD
ncbi:MAG: 2Fe-2S iron-sulfur cluster binding domain-containing protein [Pyrinomonadaceae bacterium]|nr:2Fe-2S iron-sulfur cluster binding domain-containing protein [Pyrinomonadaceae bacterium]